MKVSFEGIGESVITFYNNEDAAAFPGEPVKISGNGEVSACSEGDRFFGLALACQEDYAAVQNAGFAVFEYSGTDPLVGYGRYVADGEGGIMANENGGEFLVIEVDTTGRKVAIML